MTEKRSYDLMNRGAARQGKLRGFTLIELMVGLAIISMMLLYLVPSMGAWIQSTRIRNAAESIENALQLARAEAVSRNTQIQLVFPSLVSSGTAVDWVVSCVNASATCPGTGQTTTYIQKMSAKEGSTGAQLVTSSGQTSIVFSGLGRASSVAAGSTLTLTITNPNGGTCAQSGGTMRCLNIVLTPSGQVRMCDPALPNTNPRGC
jgi:type IV fimbrial biogenesis protein FimT